MSDYDVIVIGGGMIGAAIAYGLARLGQKTAVLDEGDIAFRAARGNFGLIWVQGKGKNCPQYASWTRHSADVWGKFNAELSEVTGSDIAYDRSGGISFCLSQKEFEDRNASLNMLAKSSNGAFQYEMLEHKALSRLLPGLGKSVTGGSFCPQDGHVNPLFLLRALHAAFKKNGGILHNQTVLDLFCKNGRFFVTTAKRTYSAAKIVLAAGLGNKQLAPKLGMCVPVHPERGQILVTERMSSFLNYPTVHVRQTTEGSVLLGDSHENAGFDAGTSSEVMGQIAKRACLLFPHLKKAQIVRAWGALRILTPDGLPVYDQSLKYPGAFCASAHSGVTLAAAHALDFAKYVVQGQLPSSLNTLSEARFHVH